MVHEVSADPSRPSKYQRLHHNVALYHLYELFKSDFGFSYETNRERDNLGWTLTLADYRLKCIGDNVVVALAIVMLGGIPKLLLGIPSKKKINTLMIIFLIYDTSKSFCGGLENSSRSKVSWNTVFEFIWSILYYDTIDAVPGWRTRNTRS